MALSIAYLCDHSPLNRTHYSGGNARMYEALRSHAGEVTILGTDWHAAQPVRRMIQRLPVAVQLRLRWRAHLALSRIIAKGVEAELQRGRFDAVFCAYSIWSLHRVRVPAGMVSCFCSDTTQTVFQSSEVGAQHNGFRWSRMLDGWVQRAETQILGNTDLVLWPSRWQQDKAQALYDLPAGKAHCLPWGANLDPVPRPAPRALQKGDTVRLLLIGRDWRAKGGPMAFETMQSLRERGIPARLTVIGCVPPPDQRNSHVTALGLIDKSDPEQARLLHTALEQAHFLVQPSYESYGFAFCEASAYGLPALCLRAGGVPVVDGVNGEALPLGSGARDFADVIQRYVDAPDAYHALTRSSRQCYESELNWDAWGQGAAHLLRDAVARKRS